MSQNYYHIIRHSRQKWHVVMTDWPGRRTLCGRDTEHWGEGTMRTDLKRVWGTCKTCGVVLDILLSRGSATW